MKIERIEAVRCTLGEGPVWDVADEALYLLDIGQRKIIRYRPCDETVRSWNTPMPPGAVAIGDDGAVVAMKDTLYAMSFASGELSAIARASDQSQEATFNDGKVDRQGRFIVGSCSTNLSDPRPIGGIYSLGLDRRLTKLAGDIAFSNSPCFSPDGRTLYFSDSARYQIFAYEYDVATGLLGERRNLANTRELGGMPDGATVDRDGLVWVAIMEGSKIAAFRPDGTLERAIDLPTSLPGSVMFGGPKLDQLFVATIDPVYFGRSIEPGAGYLYRIDDLGTSGLAEPRFAG